MPDVNIRNVPEDVLERLKAQAGAQGVSLSEWVRVALADRAALPTAAELGARRAGRGDDQVADGFADYYRARLHRRTA